ncbi:MAG: hypothetical protein OXF72_00140 [Gammaproteobacteria bacterium]|nr:hypothetical protein [Gammaproteobacteria bacterium]
MRLIVLASLGGGVLRLVGVPDLEVERAGQAEFEDRVVAFNDLNIRRL